MLRSTSPATGGPPARTPPFPVPSAVAADLAGLSGYLGRSVPAKAGQNLLIGTWNVRALGGYTDRWTARSGDSPKRGWHAMACIAEVLSRFDVTAIQETRRDTSALFAVLSLLGPDYRVIASDVTEGDQGNGERGTATSTTPPGSNPRAWSGRSSCPHRRRTRSASSPATPTPPGSCATASSSSSPPSTC